MLRLVASSFAPCIEPERSTTTVIRNDSRLRSAVGVGAVSSTSKSRCVSVCTATGSCCNCNDTSTTYRSI